MTELFKHSHSKLERLSMRFTAKGKMKFPFCQNTEKLDLIKLLSCLLTRYIVGHEWDKLKNVKFHAFVTGSCLLFAVCRKRNY